jgi:hypothetical protein
MAMFMEISSWLSAINILLVLSLLYVYIRNYAKVKSDFTLGLGLFALLFLVHNAVALYYHLTMMPLYVAGVETYALIFSGLQTAAFLVLNWITWK